jgi:hypothetical protein
MKLINVNAMPLQIKQFLQAEKPGKCVTSQDVRNLKGKKRRLQRGNDNEGQLLVDAVNSLIENDAGSSVNVVETDGELQAVCWQTSMMKEKYRKFGHVLFVDSTYKLNIERFPLLVFLVEDGVGCGVPVLFSFVQHETANILTSVLKWFCEQNDISITNVIVVDKDIKLLNVLKDFFQQSTVLLCLFHVLRYIRKVIIAMKEPSSVKRELLQLVAKMVYAYSQSDYNDAYNNLMTNDQFPASFRTYFTDNWHSCKEQWSMIYRQDLLTLGNNTNNRIENFNRQLKKILKPDMHLSETVRRLNDTTLTIANDMGYKRYREIGFRTDASTDMPNGIGMSLTNIGSDMVSTQYKKFLSNMEYAVVTESEEHVITVGKHGRQYTVGSDITDCSCSFFSNFHLPCWHMFCARHFKRLPLYDESLEVTVPPRWRRAEILHRVDLNTTTPCGSTVTSVGIRKVPTVRSEQQRYMCAHIETEALACYIASCGGSDFEQKLQQIKHLLQLWQSGNTVEISISDANLEHVEQGEEFKTENTDLAEISTSIETQISNDKPVIQVNNTSVSKENTDLAGISTSIETQINNDKPVIQVNNTSVSNNPCNVTQKRAFLSQSVRNKLRIPVVKKCRGRPRGRTVITKIRCKQQSVKDLISKQRTSFGSTMTFDNDLPSHSEAESCLTMPTRQPNDILNEATPPTVIPITNMHSNPQVQCCKKTTITSPRVSQCTTGLNSATENNESSSEATVQLLLFSVIRYLFDM